MEPAEEKIVRAALTSIEKYGLDNVTIRNIAEEAGVNSAAISYYFRSKDKLLEIALLTALQNSFQWEDYVYTESYSALAQLVAVFYQFTEEAIRWPKISKSFLMDAFLKEDYSGPGIRRFNDFLATLALKLLEKCPQYQESDLRRVLLQMTYAIFTLIFTPNVLQDFYGADLTDHKARKDFIQSLAESLWNPDS